MEPGELEAQQFHFGTVKFPDSENAIKFILLFNIQTIN